MLIAEVFSSNTSLRVFALSILKTKALLINILGKSYISEYFCFFSCKNYNTRVIIPVVRAFLSNILLVIIIFPTANADIAVVSVSC